MGTALAKIKQKFNKSVKHDNVVKSTQEHDFAKVINSNHSLLDMMMYRRPSAKMDDPTYVEFLTTFIEPLFGKPDQFGNYVTIIPTGGKLGDTPTQTTMPQVCYTAHHDTVHDKVGKQTGMLFYNVTPFPIDNRSVMGNRTVATDTYLWVKNEPETTTTETYYTNMYDHVSKQTVKKENTRIVKQSSANSSSCLGADCTTGVWLICEMIKANCPGVYCIFAKEEVGRIGSMAIVKQYTDAKAQVAAITRLPFKCFKPLADAAIDWDSIPFDDKMESMPYSYWIDSTKIMISFDRKNIGSIITRQSGGNCASQLFVNDLTLLLSPELLRNRYETLSADPGGTYTDSASFMKLIPECTNLSVGYLNQHQDTEIQNYSFAVALRDSLIANADALNNPVKLGHYRDPMGVETNGLHSHTPCSNGYGGNGYAKNVNLKNASLADSGYMTFDDADDYADFFSKSHYKDPVRPEIKDYKDYKDPITPKSAEVITMGSPTVPGYWNNYDDDISVAADAEDEEDDLRAELIDQFYDDAVTDIDHENKVSVAQLGLMVDLIDHNIDDFAEFIISKGISEMEITNYVLSKKLAILERFKSYLIDNDITLSEVELKEYAN